MDAAGVILQDAELLFDSDDNLYHIAVASNFGLGVGRILSDGSLEDAKDWDWSQTGALLEIEELEVNSPNNQLIGLGLSGTGNVFEVSSSGLIEEVNTVSTAITNQLATGNATVTDIEHGLANGNLTLFIATDRGLLISETNSGRDGDIAEWRFYFTQEDTGIFASINELRTLPVGSDENPAEIRIFTLMGLHQVTLKFFGLGHPQVCTR